MAERHGTLRLKVGTVPQFESRFRRSGMALLFLLPFRTSRVFPSDCNQNQSATACIFLLGPRPYRQKVTRGLLRRRRLGTWPHVGCFAAAPTCCKHKCTPNASPPAHPIERWRVSGTHTPHATEPASSEKRPVYACRSVHPRPHHDHHGTRFRAIFHPPPLRSPSFMSMLLLRVLISRTRGAHLS